MNIDFSKFHKIECDDRCTVLQHPNGHQIKISHKHLDPKHQKELDKMPMKMAKGGFAKFSQKYDPNMGAKASKASESSSGTGAPVPEAAYTPPKMAKDAYTEPDNGGTDIVLKELNRQMPPFGPLGTEKPHYPPCINPSCKSYGRSHPNCRCYGGNPEGKPSGEMPGMFAKGGVVGDYCSRNNPHKEGCEYYKGGEVKGVHKSSMDIQNPSNKKEKRWAGESMAGQDLRNSDINDSSMKNAKDEHHRVYGEMKAMKKPNLKGFVHGGMAMGEDPVTVPDDEVPATENTEPQIPTQVEPEPKIGPSDENQAEIAKEVDDLDKNNKDAEAAQMPAPQEPAQDPGLPINPEVSSSAPQQVPEVHPVEQHAQAIQNVLQNERAGTSADIASGNIHPKTYNDLLWKDKSTPAKLGTLFGLLIGGAGAGISGQKSAILEMMDHTIQRDTAAQQQSAENRKNLLKINQENLANNANVNLTKNQADTLGFHLTNSQKMRDSLDKFTKQVDAMPEGPDKLKAQQELVYLNAMAQKDIASGDALHSMAIAQSNFNPYGETHPSQGGKPQGSGAVNYDKFNKLDMMNKMKIPGSPNDADMGTMRTEAAHLDQVRALRSDYQKGYDTLDKLFAAGDIPGFNRARTSILQGLAAKAAPVVGVGHANDLVESMMPQRGDWKSTKKVKQNSNEQYFNVLEAGHPTLQRYGLINPPSQSAEAPLTSKTGKQIIVKNGKHYYK